MNYSEKTNHVLLDKETHNYWSNRLRLLYYRLRLLYYRLRLLYYSEESHV